MRPSQPPKRCFRSKSNRSPTEYPAWRKRWSARPTHWTNRKIALSDAMFRTQANRSGVSRAPSRSGGGTNSSKILRGVSRPGSCSARSRPVSWCHALCGRQRMQQLRQTRRANPSPRHDSRSDSSDIKSPRTRRRDWRNGQSRSRVISDSRPALMLSNESRLGSDVSARPKPSVARLGSNASRL